MAWRQGGSPAEVILREKLGKYLGKGKSGTAVNVGASLTLWLIASYFASCPERQLARERVHASKQRTNPCFSVAM